MIEKVYEVYGDVLPERNVYGSSDTSPSTINEILKEYKTWNRFKYAYEMYVSTKRASAVKVETKKAEVKKVETKATTKAVVKNEDKE